MEFETLQLPNVGVLYGSGLFDGDEQCFEDGQTYDVFLAKVPFDLDSEPAVVLYKDGSIYGWLKKRSATFTQHEAFKQVVSALKVGKSVKVTITSVGNLSRPRFDGRVGSDRQWCNGTARWSWEEVLPQEASVKTLVGQVDVSFGSRLYSAAREAPFVRGGRYILEQERVPYLGSYGTALKQQDPARHCGYVSRDTADVVESYLLAGKRVVAEVTSALEGNRRRFCRHLRTERDWWNGRALCWLEENVDEAPIVENPGEISDDSSDTLSDSTE